MRSKNNMKSKSIPPSTFKFLIDVAKNNNRPWFAENKSRYQEAYTQMKEFSDVVLNKMTHIDEIEELKVYRIYRDVRFSKDKLPYKTHMSGYLRRATKKLRGGYYFHIEPGHSFVGGGFWGPNSADLKRIRQEIAADDKPLRKIINSTKFKKTFGTLQGECLKTAPRGFAKDHPAIDLLRHKQFIIWKSFSDDEVLSPKFSGEIIKVFKNMRPFFDYMSEVLTTDSNGVPLED